MIEVLKYISATFGRLMFSLWGAILAIMEPQIPFFTVCTLMVIADAISAWALSRRVKRKYPGATDGKFKSCHFGRVFVTLIKIYVVIILIALIEQTIFESLPVKMVNVVAGAICFWQGWSILENESSCNNAKWARIAQRIMVDKTERHFDIDLHELKHEEDHVEKTEDLEDCHNGES